MSNEEEQYDDSTMGGPGAPTPVSALEVGSKSFFVPWCVLTVIQGVNGLTARDIKLVIEGGFNTVESIAYTYVGHRIISSSATNACQAATNARTDQGYIGTKGDQVTS